MPHRAKGRHKPRHRTHTVTPLKIHRTAKKVVEVVETVPAVVPELPVVNHATTEATPAETPTV